MKVEPQEKETPFQQGIRLVLQDLCMLFENPQDQDAANAIQEHLKVIAEKYKKNILFELLQKMLFGMGIYHHQEVSLKLFNLKKRNVEKLVTAFRKNGVEGVIANLVSQLYIKLDQDTFGELIREVIYVLGNTIYDGNEEGRIIKLISVTVPLEIFEDEEEDNVEFKRVVQRKRVEKSMIIFDDGQKEIYWPKESFEDFVQQIKKHQQCECLSVCLDLIGKIREKQTNIIIDVNSVGQEDLASIPEHLRKKFEKLKSENESVRSLISQGFNTNSFHFILEFIQNADDSEYLQDGTGGTLEFDFNKNLKMLKIKSNESGFTFDNLYSLSGIADSDKVAKKLETPAIGEKGIGFKTVFSVCDKVHLVSNGFDVVLTSLDLKRKESETFNLSEGTLYEIEIEKFDHSIFDKYTLLTLKNIKTIIFKDNSKTTTYSLKCQNNEYLLTTTVKKDIFSPSTITVEKFYGFSINNGINMKNISCEKRPNFHRADLTLFFPEHWKSDRRFKLHSFLPVKEDYNLPLLIQSDFILSQNREALLESEWNTTIINHIPQLLVQSFNTMKHINNWKYDFFRVLQVELKLHFSNIQTKTIRLLQNVDCIPVISNTKDFATPSNIILMGDSPINPFTEFGIELCCNILNKECIEKEFENENLLFKQWSKLFTKLDKQNIISLAQILPADLKLAKIEKFYKLFKHFNISVKSLDFEIVPTRLKKLVKPSENIFDNYEFSVSSLVLLEKASYHGLSPVLGDLKELVSTKKELSNLTGLSKQELFVLFYEQSAILSPFCLTLDGEWIHPNQCYFHSEHTNYVDKAKFVDMNGLIQILSNNRISTNAFVLTNFLAKFGTKVVPTLFTSTYGRYLHYNETVEFKELRKKYPTLEGLIQYFDNNFEKFEAQLGGIHNFLNMNIQNLYNRDLRSIFGDAIDYLPNIYHEKLKSGLNAKKEDFQAYQKLILHTKSAKSIELGLKSKFSTQIQRLLQEQPLLMTTDGDLVVLDNNLFSSMNEKLKKYRPEWKEISSNYKYYDQILSILKKISISDYKAVLIKENPSYPDQEHFIETIIRSEKSSSTSPVYLSNIYVTIDGIKIPLSDMFWDLPCKEVFPTSVNQRLLSCHFSSRIIKSEIESNKNIKTLPELRRILDAHLDKITKDGISKLGWKSHSKEITQLQVLVNLGFDISLPYNMAWNLYELKDIPYFTGFDLSSKFGEYTNLVSSKDNNNNRALSEITIKDFLKSEKVTDIQFLNVWKYCKRITYKQSVMNFIYNNGLIVCNEKKYKNTELFKNINNEIKEHFPSLQLLKVDDRYNDFDISKEIPIHIIYKEIEKLEKETDINTAEKKCIILYQEINRQIKNGLVNESDTHNFKIFRSDKGKHFPNPIYYCDNEDCYKKLQNVVDCLFVTNLTELSHFIQFFNIKPLSDKISYKHPKGTPSTMKYDQILKKFRLLVNHINEYLSRKGFTPLTIDLKIVKNLTVTAIIENGNSSEISTEIHADIESKSLYILETKFGDAMFQDKKFINTLLSFYPPLGEDCRDVLTLLILTHGITQDGKVAMSLIL